ncbi:capsid protein [Crucivirus-345]|nr:capsid protein [Crucivirus-345]
MNRSVRTSKTGGVTRKASGTSRASSSKMAAPRAKRWTFAADAKGFGIGGGIKISSKRKGMSRAVAPSATSTTVSQYKPKVSGGSAANSFTIENRELLSSCLWQGSNGFELTEFSINPGLSSIFQFASNASKNYTRYAMNMRLVWAPSVPSTTSGQIAFAMDRDNTSVAPSSMQEVLSYESNVVTNIWSCVNFPENGMFASSEKLLYLRYGPLDDLSQINLYDLMKCYICLNGIAGASLGTGQSLGSVYIEYKITFFNQKLQDIVESNIFSVQSTSAVGPGTVAIADDDDTTKYLYQYGEGDVQYLLQNSSTGHFYLIFPTAGYYTVDFYMFVSQDTGTITGPIQALSLVSELITVGTEVINGDLGTGSFNIETNLYTALTTNATNAQAHTKYVCQVLSSGSYSGSNGAPIGEGWLYFDPGTILASIAADPNIGTAVFSCYQSYCIVNRISAAEAYWFYPLAFPEGASPSPLTQTISHRRKFHPVKGHARQNRRPPHPTSSSKQMPPLLEDQSEKEESKEPKSEYDEFLAWKKKSTYLSK